MYVVGEQISFGCVSIAKGEEGLLPVVNHGYNGTQSREEHLIRRYARRLLPSFRIRSQVWRAFGLGWVEIDFSDVCFSHRKPRRVCERNVIPVDGKVGRMHEDVRIVVQDGVQSLAAVQDKLLPVVVLFAPLASLSFQSVMGQSAMGKQRGNNVEA